MTSPAAPAAHSAPLDAPTRLLVRLAARIAAGTEEDVRAALIAARDQVESQWIEELILQSYLFSGFPRTLNAAREWRRLDGDTGRPATARPGDGVAADAVDGWRRRGEATCATVYGAMYGRLRRNIQSLHPALDDWMIVEGYGKVLSRPGLDLVRRELCIVAACAVTKQDRQLHSHLHGALNAGALADHVSETLAAIGEFVSSDDRARMSLLWARVARA
jgi:4-carboxymuconolactone decarboxylase